MSHPIDQVGIVDLMIGFPKKNAADHYQFLAGAVKDAESKTMAMPAQYMFTEVPSDVQADTDTVAMLIADMDRCGVARGMVHMGSDESVRALRDHPDRIIGCVDADPNDIVGAIRRIRHAHAEWGIKAVKWPGLYYMTSAFAPKYFPREIIDYANSRGVNKVMYAGYYPMGLSLDRIVAELREVPFRDHVWPRFLRDNAVDVFKL